MTGDYSITSITLALVFSIAVISVIANHFLYEMVIKPRRLWNSIKKGQTLTFFEKRIDPFQETHEVYKFQILDILEGYVQYHQHYFHDHDDYLGLRQSKHNWDMVASMKGIDFAHWLIRLQKKYTLEIN